MSTKIGIIAEGSIDHTLLPPLLSQIARQKANFDWPLDAEDVAEPLLFIRKRGDGGVLETVRKLVKVLDKSDLDHAFFVIVLDRKTPDVQRKVRRLIRGKGRFVLGIAIEEIEAWWLGDRTNTLAWLGLKGKLPADSRYGQRRYKAEKDGNPKKTLNELTELSDECDRCYGRGSTELAMGFVENYWQINANLGEIAGQCPRGFGKFQDDTMHCFSQARTKAGRLF